jgi:hypothetical protein
MFDSKFRWHARTSSFGQLTVALSIAALTLAIPTQSLSHGGGLDADGCHVRRATGEYHCHRGGSVSSGVGRISVQQKNKAKSKKSVYRPIRASEGAVPFRPVIDSSDTICACSRQARCTGPRGGVYCINGSGNKRYFSR